MINKIAFYWVAKAEIRLLKMRKFFYNVIVRYLLNDGNRFYLIVQSVWIKLDKELSWIYCSVCDADDASICKSRSISRISGKISWVYFSNLFRKRRAMVSYYVFSIQSKECDNQKKQSIDSWCVILSTLSQNFDRVFKYVFVLQRICKLQTGLAVNSERERKSDVEDFVKLYFLKCKPNKKCETENIIGAFLTF